MISMLRTAHENDVMEIIYLGDGFQYLIGMAKFWTPGVMRIIEVWRRLRSAGVQIGIVEGNRDFFLDAPELASEIDWAATTRDLDCGGIRVRLVHGDKVNRRDLQYRFWSGISKSTVARVWARLLPRPIAVRIVTTMEARLAETNRKFRYSKPIADLKRAARSAWAEGVDLLLWGHFHTMWSFRKEGRAAVILPAWLDTGRGALIDDDGPLLLVEKNLTLKDTLFTMQR